MYKNTQYLIDESRWLLSFGTPPLDVARALHRAPSSLYQMAIRRKLTDIQEAFAPICKEKKS